jgi:alpha-galactosidase/6-phospho-beta-glucosidase family protein
MNKRYSMKNFIEQKLKAVRSELRLRVGGINHYEKVDKFEREREFRN